MLNFVIPYQLNLKYFHQHPFGGTKSGPILCCLPIGDYPEHCLKIEKVIVIEKKNYPPIVFLDDISSITTTVAKSVILNCFAPEFQKSKKLQFHVPKCKILPIFSQLKSCDIYILSLNNEHMQIADAATYLGEKFDSKGNNSSMVQCVEIKTHTSAIQ